MERKPNKVHLSAEFVRAVLSYDPETGLFRWKRRKDRSKRWNTRYAGTVAGQISAGYRLIQLETDRGSYRAPRLAWLYMTGEWPPDQIDHINGHRGDDRWENLRIADNAQNGANKAAQRNNRASGLRGVTRAGRRWRARIVTRGKLVDLGCFNTPEAASAAYVDAARRLNGEFVREN